MAEVKLIVDHLKLEYEGLFDLTELRNTIDAWAKERAVEKREDKNFEYHTLKGKFIEHEINHWRKLSEETNYMFRVRMLVYNLKEVEVIKDKKKVKINQGRLLMYFDGYLEQDYESQWELSPIHHFLRTVYDKFVYKAYTERFEQRLIHDMHYLYNMVESFLNTYKHFRPVSKVSHFSY